MRKENKSKRGLIVALLLTITVAVIAQKPKWVGNTPQELNYTYKFVEVVSHGSGLDGARVSAIGQLADNEQLQDGIRVYRKTKETETIDKRRINNGPLQKTKDQHIVVETTIDGEKYNLQANRIDEWGGYKNGTYELHTLYQVATCEDPVFDRTYLTTNYGATPVVMSIVPGLGQWYKGSKVKGICMFGATAAAVAGIIICNNEANTAEKNIKLEPKYAKHYEDKKSNWETGRNISIGAAAAIWIYNMIDAAVAKGARRVEVKPAGRSYVSLTPALNTDYAGFSLSYNF